MLSIGKIALGQHRYYEQQVAQGHDDYYSGRGEAPGEWVGAGAEALGLEGRVQAQQFNALVEGRDPRDSSQRLRSAERAPQIAALDLTFSAPKSVSVLTSVACEDVAVELVLAHEEAVRAALAYLEDTAVQVRRGRGGERVEAGEGLIGVAYRHRMSRALDPQLHTHVVAANLSRGPDGRYTALHGTPLYRSAQTAGYLYQAHLRARITDRLGLEWRPVHKGAADLAGVPERVLSEFSKRRHEMERAAQAGGLGLSTKAMAQAAALATRERKQYGVETHTWQEEVKARAGELGLDREHIAEMLSAGEERRQVAPLSSLEGAADGELGTSLVGPHGITERANTFDAGAVLRAFAAAAPEGATVADVRGQAERFARRPDVMATVGGGMTTRNLVDCERALIATAVDRGHEAVAMLDGRRIDGALARVARPLSAEQAAALREVVGSGRGVDVIEALAGTGKTYLAGALRDVYEAHGYTVLGVAPTGRGARELREQAGISARTLDRLLIDLEQLGDTLPSRSVIVFDEAGMAATRPTARLLAAAERSGAKVVAIGDPGQLASVQAGGWLRAVGRQVGAQRLTEVMRQRDPTERRALSALHGGRPESYLAWAERAGRIEVLDGAANAREQAILEWAAAVEEVGPADAVLIARDNDTRSALNRAAREVRRQSSGLGEQRRYGVCEVAVGDRVICRRNDALIDIDNGTRGTVRDLDEDRVVIETDSGLIRELPCAYVADHVEHAYALTGHGMQGATVQSAIVVAHPHDLTAGWSYTALSRARDQTRLLVHHKDHLPEEQPFTTPSRPGVGETLAAVERRMRVRDDEDLAVEQLTPAGRPDDDELASARRATADAAQERAALAAEPEVPDRGIARLAELRDRLEHLIAQRNALPLHELERLDDLHTRTLVLSTERAELSERLSELPEARRLLRGDPHATERATLTAALVRTEARLSVTADERVRLQGRVGNPEQIRSEFDGIQRAIGPLVSEHATLRDELIERELAAPGPWAPRTLGERPSGTRGEIWDAAVRRLARYRVEHGITNTHDPLGPEPKTPAQRAAWSRARETMDLSRERLGHDRDRGHDLGIDR